MVASPRLSLSTVDDDASPWRHGGSDEDRWACQPSSPKSPRGGSGQDGSPKCGFVPTSSLPSVSGRGSLKHTPERGGAVLWFMRRHAPMPSPFPDVDSSVNNPVIDGVASLPGGGGGVVASASNKSDGLGKLASMSKTTPASNAIASDACSQRAQGRARAGLVYASAGGPRTGGDSVRQTRHDSGLQGPQRRFLHQTLLAIGSELDEHSSGSRAPATARISREETASRMTSAKHRDDLRQCYAAHTASECEHLRAEVDARLAEVETLKRRVDQLERFVEATNAAAKHRKERLRGNVFDVVVKSGGITNDETRNAVSDKMHKNLRNVQRMFTAKAGLNVFDAEAPPEQKVADVDNWQLVMARQLQELSLAREKVEGQFQQFQRQTVQRKATEAALFGAHTEALQMRARALHAEARVTRLANELRRVYKHVPEVIAHRTNDFSVGRGAEQKEKELGSIKEGHREQHFKFMEPVVLRSETKDCDAHIKALSVQILQVSYVAEHGWDISTMLFRDTKAIQKSLERMQSVWEQMQSDERSKGPHQDQAPLDDAQVLFQEVALAAVSIRELLTLMSPSDPKALRACTKEE